MRMVFSLTVSMAVRSITSSVASGRPGMSVRRSAEGVTEDADVARRTAKARTSRRSRAQARLARARVGMRDLTEDTGTHTFFLHAHSLLGLLLLCLPVDSTPSGRVGLAVKFPHLVSCFLVLGLVTSWPCHKCSRRSHISSAELFLVTSACRGRKSRRRNCFAPRGVNLGAETHGRGFLTHAAVVLTHAARSQVLIYKFRDYSRARPCRSRVRTAPRSCFHRSSRSSMVRLWEWSGSTGDPPNEPGDPAGQIDIGWGNASWPSLDTANLLVAPNNGGVHHAPVGGAWGAGDPAAAPNAGWGAVPDPVPPFGGWGAATNVTGGGAATNVADGGAAANIAGGGWGAAANVAGGGGWGAAVTTAAPAVAAPDELPAFTPAEAAPEAQPGPAPEVEPDATGSAVSASAVSASAAAPAVAAPDELPALTPAEAAPEAQPGPAPEAEPDATGSAVSASAASASAADDETDTGEAATTAATSVAERSPKRLRVS